MKTNVMATHQKCLADAFLMRTHNICFYGEMNDYVSAHPADIYVRSMEWQYIIRKEIRNNSVLSRCLGQSDITNKN